MVTTGERPPALSAGQFDVFLSYNSRDKPAVRRLAEQLRDAGLQPWLDDWWLTPGGDWQHELAAGLRASAACALVVGPHGLGDWARMEVSVAQDRAAKDRSFRVFPVLLPGVPEPFDPTAGLPPFIAATSTWVDLRPGLADQRSFQRLVNAIKGVAPGPDAPPEAEPGRPPYRGLRPFEEADAELFFGREADVQRLIEKLKGTRFLAVLGPSGSGKSSLVKAGLVPALRRGVLPGSQDWTIEVLTPDAQPLTALAARLARRHPDQAVQKTLDGLAADARSLHLAAAVAMAERPPGEQLVWVVDQLEEVFTLCGDGQQRARFLSNLHYAATIPGGRCRVIVTLRADFYARFAAHAELASQLAAHQYMVGPLEGEALRQVVEEPARRVGLELEAGLTDTILADAGHEPGMLPLLEHALLRLWERRRGRMLTLEGYRASGGVQGALAQHAEEVYGALTPAQQAVAQEILLRLVQPGEGTEDTRRRATMSEMTTGQGGEETAAAVVQALAGARLLTTSRDEETGQEWVDVAHEALIRGWPRLRGLIDERRAELRVHRRLTGAAREWEQRGRDEGVLYRGARLAEAVEWRARDRMALNAMERAFLDASLALQSRERRAARRRVVVAIGGLLVALIAISAAAIYAFLQAEEARAQQKIATSRELAASALAQLAVDPELGVLLASEAARAGRTEQAEEALRSALMRSPVRAELRGHTGAVTAVAFSPQGDRVITASGDGAARLWASATGASTSVLSGHEQTVRSAAFSPDGRLAVTASDDGTARIWDAASGSSVAVLRGHAMAVLSAGFSPDGTAIVTAGSDGTARLWEASSGRALGELRGHGGPVTAAVFGPGGRLLTASLDGTARVWDAVSRSERAVLTGHGGPVTAAAFSPDGQRVATTSTDGTARLWDADSGRPLTEPRRHGGSVSAVAYSPDGQRLVTASADGTARVWDAASGAEVAVLTGHGGPVTTASFSPDGRSLLTTSADRTGRLWRPGTGEEIAVLRGHSGAVTAAAFSRDGGTIATAGFDNTARLWKNTTGEDVPVLAGHNGDVYSVAFSPDGQRLITASADGTARIWEAGSGATAAVLSGHAGGVTSADFGPEGLQIVTTGLDGTVRTWSLRDGAAASSAAMRGHQGWVYIAGYSPDGARLVSAGRDATARLWDARVGRPLGQFRAHDQAVTSATFSPDGRQIVTSSEDATARVWDAATGDRRAEMRGHARAVRVARFSHDGRYVATASEDETARLWNAATGASLTELRGHIGGVYSAAFSADDRWLVTGSADRTARVWSVATGGRVADLRGHSGAVWGVAFAPDGRAVATASADGTVRLFPWEAFAPLDDLLDVARQRVTRGLSASERQKYLHERTGG